MEHDGRTLFSRRWSRGKLITADAVFAVVYALGLASVVGAAPEGVPYWQRLAAGAAVALPLALRRVRPLPVFAVVLVATVAALSAGVLREPFIAAALALYLVALTAPRRRFEPTLAIAAGTAVVFVCSSGVGVDDWWSREAGVLVVGVTFLGAAWTVGRAVRERREYADRNAARLTRHAVTEERLRIARELHDVVAHSLGVITVKAGVANHVIGTDPEEARDAMRVIETAGRGALTELRGLLGVLRADEEDDALAPVPGLPRVPELAAVARMAGVDVDLSVDDPGDVPDGVALAAYRIVQEALTNVVKHAAPTSCRVRVAATAPGELAVEVADDGPGRRVLPDLGGGHGMLGMRERVAVYGGTLQAGPRPEGGFAVTATLPYRPVEGT